MNSDLSLNHKLLNRNINLLFHANFDKAISWVQRVEPALH